VIGGRGTLIGKVAFLRGRSEGGEGEGKRRERERERDV